MHEQNTKIYVDKPAGVYQDIHDPTISATDAGEFTYPLQDGGKGAWLFLLGACIIEVTAWGMYSTVLTTYTERVLI